MNNKPQPFPRITWETEFESNYEDFSNRVRRHQIGQKFGVSNAFYKFLFDCAFNGPGTGYIVELGTEYGHSLCYLAAGSKAARREQVITVDSDRGSVNAFSMATTANAYWNFWDRAPMRQARLQLNLIIAGVYDWVVTIGCETKLAAKMLDIPIRILYVDAGHKYDDCSADILLFQDSVVKGGLLICHDYKMGGVAQAVQDHVVKSESFSDIEMVNGSNENTIFAYKL